MEFYVNGRTGHHVNVSTQNTAKVVNGRAIVMCKYFFGIIRQSFNFKRDGKVEEKSSLDCNPACGKETDHYQNDYCDGFTEWNPWSSWRKGPTCSYITYDV